MSNRPYNPLLTVIAPLFTVIAPFFGRLGHRTDRKRPYRHRYSHRSRPFKTVQPTVPRTFQNQPGTPLFPPYSTVQHCTTPLIPPCKTVQHRSTPFNTVTHTVQDRTNTVIPTFHCLAAPCCALFPGSAPPPPFTLHHGTPRAQATCLAVAVASVVQRKAGGDVLRPRGMSRERLRATTGAIVGAASLSAVR